MNIQATASIGLLPVNGKLVPFKNPVLQTQDSRVTALIKGGDRVERDRASERLNGGSISILMPTFINTHTHAAMSLMRGITDDVPLLQWLNHVIWPLETHVKKWHVEAGARLAALESLITGTTTLNTHYFYPDAEAQAFFDVGVRGVIADPIIETQGPRKVTDALIKQWHTKNNDMTRVAFGPHAPYTVRRETYETIRALQDHVNESFPEKPVLLHTHIAETKHELTEITNFLEANDEKMPANAQTPVQYLHEIGVLHENLIGAHYVWTTTKDRELLKTTNAGISINLISNLKLGSGVPPVLEYLNDGLQVSIGTDGASSNNTLNMFETLRILPLIYKGLSHDPTVLPIQRVLYLATKGGANTLHWNGLGDLSPNSLADFMILELDTPLNTPVANENAAVSHLVYASSGVRVRHVVVNGEIILQDGQPTKVQPEKVLDEAYRATYDLLEKAELPHEKWYSPHF